MIILAAGLICLDLTSWFLSAGHWTPAAAGLFCRAVGARSKHACAFDSIEIQTGHGWVDFCFGRPWFQWIAFFQSLWGWSRWDSGCSCLMCFFQGEGVWVVGCCYYHSNINGWSCPSKRDAMGLNDIPGIPFTDGCSMLQQWKMVKLCLSGISTCALQAFVQMIKTPVAWRKSCFLWFAVWLRGCVAFTPWICEINSW